MTPGLYLRQPHLGWPWVIAADPGYAAETHFFKTITGGHHAAPVKVADLLSIKEWVFVIEFEGEGLSFSFSETVPSGTLRKRQNTDPEIDDPITDNTPGWTTLKDAIENRVFPDTEGDYSAISGVQITWNETFESGSETLSARLILLPPYLGFDESDNPAWVIPVNTEITLLNAASESAAYASPTGIIYDGDQLGDADINGWTVTITPGGNYAS